MPSFNPLSYFLLLFALFLGISFSGLLGFIFYQNESSTIASSFKRDVDHHVAAFERELLINIEVLYAVKGLFNSSEHVTDLEFKKLASRFIVRHENIQALEWVPRVYKDEREQFEASIRKWQPDFEITERELQGNMVRAGERNEYFPVHYVEPFEGNEVAFGFDLASNAKRSKILNKSRDLDLSLTTASITLVQEVSNQKGFLVFVPVYKGEPETLTQRRLQLSGFVLGVYRIGDMFETAVQYTLSQGVNLTLIDNTEVSPEQLYSNVVPEEMPSSVFTYSKPLSRFGGRQWTLVASPTRGYISERRGSFPLIFSVFFMLFFLLGAGYLYSVIRKSSMVAMTVAEQNTNLNDIRRELKAYADIDKSTRVAHRGHFDEQFEKEWKRAIRGHTTLSMILVKVDDFTLFNEHYGPKAGDQCLKDVAMALKSSTCRHTDLVARYGEEELAILLPNTDKPAVLAGKFRFNIDRLGIPNNTSSGSGNVTISLGVISITPTQHCDPIVFITKAEQLLSQEKELYQGCDDAVVLSKGGEVVGFKSPKK